MGYAFELALKVRDYECDLQGIVNNSVYQNYLEHARHEYLLACGLSFSELAQQGTNLVVVRAELDYRQPLTSGDEFVVGLKLIRNGRLKMDFQQDIRRLADQQVMLEARITAVALNARGRPFAPDDILQQLLGNDQQAP